MKRAGTGLALFCLVCLFSIGTASADERAATAQLPAALQAVQADGQIQLLTGEQAEQVRGEGVYWVDGAVAVHNYVANGIVYFRADQPLSIDMILTKWAFGIHVQP